MPLECPNCHGGSWKIIETRNRIDGSVRRRHQCDDCRHRWTTISNGERPSRPPLKPAAKNQRRRRKLTLEQVYRILTETQLSNKELGIKLGVTYQCIQQIRRGITWSYAFPELPREMPAEPVRSRSCLKCKDWEGRCGIGLPDPDIEGPGFAADCDFYELRSQAISRACPSSDQ